MTTQPFALLEVGQEVVLDIENKSVHHSYQSTIVELSDDVIWVEVPTAYALPVGASEPRLVSPLRGEILLRAWRMMDARYNLVTRIASFRLGDRPLLGLRILDVERVQDREFLRVPHYMDVGATAPGLDGRMRRFTLHVRDISAAGLRGVSELPLGPDAELYVELILPEWKQPHTLKGRVARVIRLPRPSDPTCEIGVALIDVPPRVREQIIRFAMQVQAGMRRRGAA